MQRDTDPTNWNCEDVGKWLTENNFEEYCNMFSLHKIDGPALLALLESDLRNPPLQITILGDIKRLYLSIQKLQIDAFGEKSCQTYRDSFDGSYDPCPGSLHSSPRHRVKRMMSDESLSDDDDDDEAIEAEVQRIVNKSGRFSRSLDPEIFKTFLSFIYVFFVFLVTSFVMTIVHDRVPDPEKYPPLPDLFLDNIPYMPWAFEICELVGLILFIVWCCILVFHKHR